MLLLLFMMENDERQQKKLFFEEIIDLKLNKNVWNIFKVDTIR